MPFGYQSFAFVIQILQDICTLFFLALHRKLYNRSSFHTRYTGIEKSHTKPLPKSKEKKGALSSAAINSSSQSLNENEQLDPSTNMTDNIGYGSIEKKGRSGEGGAEAIDSCDEWIVEEELDPAEGFCGRLFPAGYKQVAKTMWKIL